VAALPTHRPLRFDSAQLIYTDGSKQGSAIGSGVYDGPRNRLLGVMPRGHAGQLNTVPKAEGTAMLAALQAAPDGEDVTLLTDSLTLIHMLRSMLSNPTRYRVHKHKHMLKKIVNTMLSRGGSTTIHKVRAHIGVAGNELADAAARVAAASQSAADPAEGEAQLHAILPDPAGTATLTAHADAMAGTPGISSSWLQYPVPQQDAATAEPELWNFDELRHHVTRWIQTVWQEALTERPTTLRCLGAYRADSEPARLIHAFRRRKAWQAWMNAATLVWFWDKRRGMDGGKWVGNRSAYSKRRWS
jgi:ribonuclease HI